MSFGLKVVLYFAMSLLGAASIWTTYKSLYESILPEPVWQIALPNGVTWDCHVIALILSLAIGMMLFTLKAAIIDGQKRLNIFGVLGMTIVAFISIAFNLDVLYRTADRDFFVRYSNEQMRKPYEEFLAQVQDDLNKRKTTAMKQLALQEGELESEQRGLRKAGAGYGPLAKEEDYKLTLLQKTTEVELQSVTAALETKGKADELLRTVTIAGIEDVHKLQGDLRVVCKDLAGVSNVTLPTPVRLENPLFVVFAKVFDWNQIGIKEVFFVIIAFFMDLGDIIGYALIPNKRRKRQVDFPGLDLDDEPPILMGRNDVSPLLPLEPQVLRQLPVSPPGQGASPMPEADPAQSEDGSAAIAAGGESDITATEIALGKTLAQRAHPFRIRK